MQALRFSVMAGCHEGVMTGCMALHWRRPVRAILASAGIAL
ncbi:hypothetical protein [Alcanivorax quisquiliarum]|nr:hypothetical protein [Alcanivorax quisquiliarum]